MKLVAQSHYGVMVAVRGEACVPGPLEEVAGQRKTVPVDHSWIKSARMVETSFGN